MGCQGISKIRFCNARSDLKIRVLASLGALEESLLLTEYAYSPPDSNPQPRSPRDCQILPLCPCSFFKYGGKRKRERERERESVRERDQTSSDLVDPLFLGKFRAISSVQTRGMVKTSEFARPFILKKSGGVAVIVCDTTGNTVRQGYCYTCLAIGGGYFRRLKFIQYRIWSLEMP